MYERGFRKDAVAYYAERGIRETELRNTTLEHLEWLGVRAYSPYTIRSRRDMLGYFLRWLQARGIETPVDLSRPLLERYQKFLHSCRVERTGQTLSVRVQNQRLVALRGFCRWLVKHGHIEHNPAGELELPRLSKTLPRNILTQKEAEAILARPNAKDPFELRDRAILETFYSTGMRRMELANLRSYDLDPARGTVLIREGKGKKDRVVPIGERALFWVDRYLTEVRPGLVPGTDEGFLFLTYKGDPCTPGWLSHMVRRYINEAGVEKAGSCHLFRHTAATLMLENGADVRYIQAMLGHAELSTTEIYTHVSIKKLKEVHERTHPARLPELRRSENNDSMEE